MLAEIRRERQALQQRLTALQTGQEKRAQAQRSAISLQRFADKITNLAFDKKRELLKTFIDGTPGTGIFVDKQRNIKIIGTLPLQPTDNPSSIQNTSMLWTVHNRRDVRLFSKRTSGKPVVPLTFTSTLTVYRACGSRLPESLKMNPVFEGRGYRRKRGRNTLTLRLLRVARSL
jgi:hypothetical protein